MKKILLPLAILPSILLSSCNLFGGSKATYVTEIKGREVTREEYRQAVSTAKYSNGIYHYSELKATGSYSETSSGYKKDYRNFDFSISGSIRVQKAWTLDPIIVKKSLKTKGDMDKAIMAISSTKPEEWDSIPDENKKNIRKHYIIMRFYGYCQNFGIDFASDALLDDPYIEARIGLPRYFVEPYQILYESVGYDGHAKGIHLNTFDDDGMLTNCYEEYLYEYEGVIDKYTRNIYYECPVEEGPYPYEG